MQKLSEDLKKRQKDASDAKKKMEELEDERYEAVIKVASLQKDNAEQNRLYDILMDENEDLHKTVTDAEARATDLEEEVSEGRHAKNQLEKKISVLEGRVTALSNLNTAKLEMQVKLEIQLRKANADIKVMKREKGQHKRSMSLAQKRISKLETGLKEANEELEKQLEIQSDAMIKMKLKLEAFQQLGLRCLEISVDSVPGSPRQSPRARSPHRAVADSTGRSGPGSPAPRSRSRSPLHSEDFDSE